MKELKVILSPHYFENEFVEEVSGIVFKKSNGVATYTINLEDGKLSGIQTALRKNILLPFDKATLDYVNGNDLSKKELPVKESAKQDEKTIEPEEKVEAEVEAAAVQEVKPAKRPRKKNKKESE
ncbi:hypothetical protein MOF23_06965 [Bacillus inaquosorum]|uniref:hypothetical protein n=1 Tax=Bacillus inaquosorum TaxID=483913 RepID=UPI0022802AB7|nr:hypothetical protein [Bacillus inaquosorum]MCY9308716.1 hypothetical protein [Bacillus inaquosorum]